MAWGPRALLLPFLVLPAPGLSQKISGSDIIVVFHGHQVEDDTREALSGFSRGIMKSGNTYLKGQIDNVKFLFLELGINGLFEHDNGIAHVKPWLQRHFELMGPRVIMSVGVAAPVVEEVTGNISAADRPAWHLKCVQDRCASSGTGVMDRETCFQFRPPARDVLRYIGELKPDARKVALLSDGSELAAHIEAGLDALSSEEVQVLCGSGCSIEKTAVGTLESLSEAVAGLEAGGATPAFILLPSMEGIAGGSVEDVWSELNSTGVAAMVPWDVARHGRFTALRAHGGSSAEECGLFIAQMVEVSSVGAHEVRDSLMYKMSVNADAAGGVDWSSGMLQHNGVELWNPVEILWEAPATKVRPPRPKVLCMHSYGRFYGFTSFEHEGFIDGLRAAGHRLDCLDGLQSCLGDVEVSMLYFLTKFYFTTGGDKELIYGYGLEYMKRYMPDVVYVTDDNGLKYGVLPCFRPEAPGPNPTYHRCSELQFVVGGINVDVRRTYRDECLVYTEDGVCAGGNFFIEEGANVSEACDACRLGNEPECPGCRDLYTRRRPVNITIHLEMPSTEATARFMTSVKPSTTKMLIIYDETLTSRASMDTIDRQYRYMQETYTTHGVSIDVENDVHYVANPEAFKQVWEAYQDRPEYMIWTPSIAGVLPSDAGERREVWKDFISGNRLGEVILPGETDDALISSAGFPESMGRVCAQYADMIIRGVRTAAELPILPAPLAKLYVNVDRPKQLQEHGILPIPANVLAAASQIFTMCPPGTYLQEGFCQECETGRFKVDYGNDQTACRLCYSLNGMQMYSSPGSTNASACMCSQTYYQQPREALVCEDSSSLANTGVCCRQCLEGTYQMEVGQSACTSCRGGKTTRFLGALDDTACQCRPGTLLSEDNSSCAACGTGEACEGWDMRTPLADAGYMMSAGGVEGARGATPVFRCYGDQEGSRRCPGGGPGACAEGRHGLQCAECEPGKMPADDGTCQDCSGRDTAPFIVLLVVGVLLLLGMYMLTVRNHLMRQSMGMLFMAISGGLLITTLQMLGVMHNMDFQWGPPVDTLLSAMTVLLFDVEILNLGCISNPAAYNRLLLKGVALPIAMTVLCLFHLLYCSLFHQMRLRQQTRVIVNSLGILNLVVFISYTSAVLAAFQCEAHPSGVSTLRKYPTVVCWDSGEHHTMMIMGCVFVLFPIAFLSVVTWVLSQLRRRMNAGDAEFMMMWAFLFYRFKTDHSYYVLLVLLRGFICSIIPIFPGAAGQILLMLIAITVFLAIICHVFPWKVYYANILDASITFCLILAIGMAPFFVEDPDVNVAGLITFVIVLVIIIFMPLSLLIKGVELVRNKNKKPYKFFLCHHKASAGAFSRLLYMVLRERTSRGIFLDWEALVDLDKLFDYVRSQTDTLVVLCSVGILDRPWCMGEIATAYVNQVDAVLIGFSGFEIPNEDFIKDYDKYCPSVLSLVAKGVPLDAIQGGMRKMREWPIVELSMSEFGPNMVPSLAAALLDNNFSANIVDTAEKSIPKNAYCLIIVNHLDWEAVASAHVLVKVIGKHIGDVSKLPVIVPPHLKDTDLPSHLACLLVLCKDNSWNSADFLSLLMAGVPAAGRSIPIIGEDGFRIPDNRFYDELTQRFGQVQMTSSHGVAINAKKAVIIIRSLFSTIGIAFAVQAPSSTGGLLDLRAAEIATRLHDFSTISSGEQSSKISKLSIRLTNSEKEEREEQKQLNIVEEEEERQNLRGPTKLQL